jgi:hypothetical protein
MLTPAMAGPGDGSVPSLEYPPFKPATWKRVHEQAVEKNDDDKDDMMKTTNRR